MVSLKIKNGSPVEVSTGFVDINGPCVALYSMNGNKEPTLILAYHLNVGEIVKREDGGKYIVEF